MAARVSNFTAFAGESHTYACAAFAAAESRTITPALALALVFVTETTRAATVPPPPNATYPYRNWSAVPHTSAPPPFTVYVPVAGTYDKQVSPDRVREAYEDMGAADKVMIDLGCSSHMAMWEKNHLLMFNASLEWLAKGTVNGTRTGVLKLGYPSSF